MRRQRGARQRAPRPKGKPTREPRPPRPPRDPARDVARGMEVLAVMRSVVVTGYGGRELPLDTEPRCPVCGKRLGEYFAVPWSLRCRDCGHQVRGG